MSQGKPSATNSLGNTRTRRQWLTFMRMCRYGINNFSRNAWLTTAATVVMVVTLLIVLSSLVARNVFADTINDLRQKVDASVYLRDDLSGRDRQKVVDLFRANPLVTDVTYISKEEARESFAQEDDRTLDELQALTEATENPLPASLRIKVSDPARLNELDPVLNNSTVRAAQHPEYESTLTGQRRDSIDTIGRIASFTERAGLALSLIAVIISILIIFNTIRMAIFNRRDEIHMMQLIGANKSFIQGPFIVEGVMYGVLAAIITTLIAYPIILTQADKLAQYEVMVQPTLAFLKSYPLLILLGLILVGSLIGIISSFLAIRRYLRV